MTSLRHAVRSLRRAPAFTVAAVATITLGVAAACAVFAIVNAVLVRPLPYANGDRLVGLWHTLPGLGIQTAKLSPGTYTLYRADSSAFEAMGLYVSLSATLTDAAGGGDARPERARDGWMTPSAFGVLGVQPLRGRLFTDADAAHGAPEVAIISERLWASRYGSDPHILGRVITINGRGHQIVGVMPASFVFPDARTPVWTPLDMSAPTYGGSFGFDGIGRLRPGVSIETAQRELTRLLPRLPERFPELRPGVSTAVALKQTRAAPVVHRMRDDVVAGFDHVLWLLAATVGLLVLVACSNVASLILVRIESRRRELAIRSALGASAAAVAWSLVGEMALVALAGGTLGIAIAAATVRLLVTSAVVPLPRLDEVRVDGIVGLVAILLVLLVVAIGAAIGLARLRGTDTARALRDAGRSGTASGATHRMRATFVAVEVALSLVLLAGSGVLARSAIHLRAVQPGFDPSNLFTVWTFLPGATYPRTADASRFYRDAIERLRSLPGVASVAETNKLPLEIEGFPYEVLIWADDGSDPKVLPPVFQATSVSAGYFGTMRIPLLAGRSFDDAMVERGANEAVVSRGFVQHFWHDTTGRSGVGKRLRPAADGPWYTIVGIVENVRDSALTLPAVPEVYFSETAGPGDTTAQSTARDMALVIRTTGPAPGLPALVRRTLHELDPALPYYRPATMEQIVADARGPLTFALALLGAGAGAALLLGIVGLYGVIAYVVSLRSREISIRIALGLAPMHATRLVARQGTPVVVIGAAAGLGLYLAFTRFLQSLTFEVSPLDATTIVLAVAGVLSISAVATWLPARRAARLDPASVLKAD